METTRYARWRLRRMLAEDDTLPGLTVDGRYRIVRYIARGGMGRVYEAHDQRLNRTVALKALMLPCFDEKSLKMFHAEIQALNRVDHRGVVPVYDSGVLGDSRLYFTMKLVNGRTLDELGSSVSRRTIAGMIAEVADIVQAAHDRGLLHLDIKPGNIMVGADGAVFLMDWGLARLMHELEGRSSTEGGGPQGTPCFMAPEQARADWGRVDPRTDVFGIGAALYAALTGKPPASGNSSSEVLRMAQNPGIIPPRDLDPTIPAGLEAICLKAMASDSDRRHSSAKAVASDLRRFVRGCTTPAPVSRRTPAGFLIAALAAVGIAIAWWVWPVPPVVSDQDNSREALLRQMLESSDAWLQAALTARRAGDLDTMRTYGENMEKACSRILALHPDLAEPHYRMARMNRALMDYERAQESADRAVKLDSRHEGARFERALANYTLIAVREHRRRRDFGMMTGGPASGTPPDPELPHNQRGILEDLRAVGNPVSLAIQAAFEGDVERSIERIRSIVAIDPLDSDAGWFAADLCATMDRFEEAENWCSQVLERDRGYLACIRLRAKILENLAKASKRPEEAFSLLSRAEEDLTLFLRARPLDPVAYVGRGWVVFQKVQYREDDEVLNRLAAAISDCTRARELDPADIVPLAIRAIVWRKVAFVHAKGGGDTDEAFKKALEDVHQCLQAQPENQTGYWILGDIELLRSIWALRSGNHAEGFLDSAGAAYQRAVELNPGNAPAWAGRGRTRLEQAKLAERAGQDAGPMFLEALSHYGEAIRLDPAIEASETQYLEECRRKVTPSK